MRATVLRDPTLVKAAGRFVWLEMDTERAGNAALAERFDIEVWPTFLVVDPATERPVLRWLGTATAPELVKLLADGRRALGEAGGDSAADLLARADRANGAGDAALAVRLFRLALEKGGPGWERRDRVLESLATALAAGGEARACAELAVREAGGMPRAQSFANVVAAGLACAEGAGSESWAAEARAALEPLAREAVALPGVLADDRAGLYEVLVEARGAAQDEAGARKVAEAWWEFLVEERARAKSPGARVMLDSWFVAAARALREPERGLPYLLASEREAPRDYNPPFRLAALYLDAGRYGEALEASARAVGLAYGPRKLSVMSQRAAILEAAGKRAEARRAVEEAIEFAGTLPSAQRDERTLERLEAKLAKLEER